VFPEGKNTNRKPEAVFGCVENSFDSDRRTNKKHPLSGGTQQVTVLESPAVSVEHFLEGSWERGFRG